MIQFSSVLAIVTFLLVPQFAHSQNEPSYKRRDIVKERFREGEIAAQLEKAFTLAAKLDSQVLGQRPVTQALQALIVEYYSSFGHRKGAPLGANFVGLPGVGKTSVMERIKEMGFPVEFIDMQKYAAEERAGEFPNDLKQMGEKYKGRPLILVMDELDKLPEISPIHGEVTRPAIGALNQLINNGTVTDVPLDFSNVLIVTTMNFSPEEMSHFTHHALKVEKPIYDMTVEDFEQFHQWLIREKSARYSVLQRLFRSNTVSRLAPNLIFFKPLDGESYGALVRMSLDSAIRATTAGAFSGRRLEVT